MSTYLGCPVLDHLPETSTVELSREDRSVIAHLLRTRGPVMAGPSEAHDYIGLVRLLEGKDRPLDQRWLEDFRLRISTRAASPSTITQAVVDSFADEAREHGLPDSHAVAVLLRQASGWVEGVL